MSSVPRNLPRFLPTLTEVVHPADLHTTALTASPASVEQIAAPQRYGSVNESHLSSETRALVSSIVAFQMQELHAILQQELEVMVKQAVANALNSKSTPH